MTDPTYRLVQVPPDQLRPGDAETADRMAHPDNPDEYRPIRAVHTTPPRGTDRGPGSVTVELDGLTDPITLDPRNLVEVERIDTDPAPDPLRSLVAAAADLALTIADLQPDAPDTANVRAAAARLRELLP